MEETAQERKRRMHKEYMRKWYSENKQKHIAYVKNRYTNLFQWIRDYKAERGCSICPEKHPACLDFHHRDSTQKEIEISNAISMKGWCKDRILVEVAKCDILCSNCHRKLHDLS